MCLGKCGKAKKERKRQHFFYFFGQQKDGILGGTRMRTEEKMGIFFFLFSPSLSFFKLKNKIRSFGC